MSGLRLYRCSVSQQAQMNRQKDTRRNVQTLGAVTDGPSATQPISLDPNERMIEAQYRGVRDDKLARELDELFDAPGIEYVPVYGIDDQGNRVESDEDGYYSLESVGTTAADPRTDRLPRVRGIMRHAGTKKSHWRALTTTQTAPENPWGATSKAEVAVPDAASRVRWYDGAASKQNAAPVATRSAQYDSLEVYDITNAPYSDPMLLYDLPYDQEGRADPSLWDTHGQSRTTTVDGQAVLQWERVFQPAHEFRGEVVFENGLAQLTIDESAQTISYEEWDDANDTWSSVSLGSSSWVPFDVDVIDIGTTHTHAHVEFTDGSSYFTLRLSVKRGWPTLFWTTPSPSTQGSIPSGLKTLLDPSASDSVYDPQASQTIQERKEVRF